MLRLTRRRLHGPMTYERRQATVPYCVKSAFFNRDLVIPPVKQRMVSLPQTTGKNFQLSDPR
ncbi:hypothetical protein OKW35_002394 [Paraburkholderia sp. MM5477-R1]